MTEPIYSLNCLHQINTLLTFSIFVLGTLLVILVTSPGWETVKTTFFDIEYGKEVFPTVVKGLWINLQLTFIGGAAIGVIALGLALMMSEN